jgi:hypothetical protein
MDQDEKKEMSDWVTHNIQIELWVNCARHCILVGDTYGYFRPFSIPQWIKYVEKPFAKWKQIKPSITKEKVIEIVLCEFKYMYICKN